jgi:hypothetical protein
MRDPEPNTILESLLLAALFALVVANLILTAISLHKILDIAHGIDPTAITQPEKSK